MKTFIHHIETLLPDYSYQQDYARDRMIGWLPGKRSRRLIHGIYDHSGIDTRHSVLPDFGPCAAPVLFCEDADGRIIEPTTHERNRHYAECSRKMIVEVGRRTLENTEGFSASDITHIITVSCTGFYNPGPDLDLVQGLGLPASTERYNLGFMGCYAAFPALRMADQFCQARPDSVVLVVCLELCTLHLQFREEADSLLANALFSDGAAAMLVSSRSPSKTRPVLAIESFSSALVPEGASDMAWEIGNHGFDLRLSTYVPKIIEAHIGSIIKDILHTPPATIGTWAIHPGGRSILDKIEDALGLDPEQLVDSRAVLRDCGNMSSVTILFVLARILGRTGIRKPQSVCAMAFGPGLTIETALLELQPAAIATPDYDAIIIGAGPVGLLLANQLGQQGRRVLLAERRTQPANGSMAIGITPPSLQILQTMELDHQFIAQGIPITTAHVYENGQALGQVDFTQIPTEHRYILSLPQTKTLEILRSNLEQYPSVHQIHGVELDEFETNEDMVHAVLREVRSDARSTYSALYFVGCDGHHSQVRTQAHIQFPGHNYPTQFYMADFTDHTPLGSAAHLYFGSHGSVESFPLCDGFRRWIVQMPLDSQSENTPIARTVIQQVMQRTGFDLSQSAPGFESTFRPCRHLASTYSHGRVLLCGDAAHVMSPIGGQGMNIGFADATHLAQAMKAAFANPDAADLLFSEYTQIRRQAFNIAANRAARNMWLGTRTGRPYSTLRRWFIRKILFGALLRERIAPHFAMLTPPNPKLIKAVPCSPISPTAQRSTS